MRVMVVIYREPPGQLEFSTFIDCYEFPQQVNGGGVGGGGEGEILQVEDENMLSHRSAQLGRLPPHQKQGALHHLHCELQKVVFPATR